MDELNNLVFDNTKVTFTGQTDNIATSDELEASLLYQDKMGTNYSKSKMAVRAFNFVGVSLILTAAAIKTGNIVSNVFAPAAPTVSDITYQCEDKMFTADFTITNSGKYEIFYYLTVNDEQVLKESCKEEKTYHIEYSNLQANDDCKFYIEYNDKCLEEYAFKVEV